MNTKPKEFIRSKHSSLTVKISSAVKCQLDSLLMNSGSSSVVVVVVVAAAAENRKIANYSVLESA